MSVVAALSLALGMGSAPSAAAPGSPGPRPAAACGGDRDDYVGLTFRGSITSPYGKKHYDLEAMFWHQPTQPYLVDLKMTSAFDGTLTTAQNSYRTSNVQWWNVTFSTPEVESIGKHTLYLRAKCDEGGTKPTALEGYTDAMLKVNLNRV
ncbi:hypothetical protein ACWDX6_28715 [Streptomyces sp. NPDC003027]